MGWVVPGQVAYRDGWQEASGQGMLGRSVCLFPDEPVPNPGREEDPGQDDRPHHDSGLQLVQEPAAERSDSEL